MSIKLSIYIYIYKFNQRHVAMSIQKQARSGPWSQSSLNKEKRWSYKLVRLTETRFQV